MFGEEGSRMGEFNIPDLTLGLFCGQIASRRSAKVTHDKVIDDKEP